MRGIALNSRVGMMFALASLAMTDAMSIRPPRAKYRKETSLRRIGRRVAADRSKKQYLLKGIRP